MEGNVSTKCFYLQGIKSLWGYSRLNRKGTLKPTKTPTDMKGLDRQNKKIDHLNGVVSPFTLRGAIQKVSKGASNCMHRVDLLEDRMSQLEPGNEFKYKKLKEPSFFFNMEAV